MKVNNEQKGYTEKDDDELDFKEMYVATVKLIRDIYRIIKKEVKLELIIITVAVVIGTCIALVQRNTKELTLSQNFRYDDYDSFFANKGNLSVDKLGIDKFFYVEDLQKKFLDLNPEIKAIYLKNLAGAEDTMQERVSFLNKIVKVEAVLKKDGESTALQYYNLSMILPKKYNSEKFAEKYGYVAVTTFFKVYLDDYARIYREAIDKKYEQTKSKKEAVEAELVIVQNKIDRVVKSSPKEAFIQNGLLGLLSIANPTLFERNNELTELYKKYSVELIGMDGLREEIEREPKGIRIVSDIYLEEQSNGGLKKIMISFIIGLLVAILVAIIKVKMPKLD